MIPTSAKLRSDVFDFMYFTSTQVSKQDPLILLFQTGSRPPGAFFKRAAYRQRP